MKTVIAYVAGHRLEVKHSACSFCGAPAPLGICERCLELYPAPERSPGGYETALERSPTGSYRASVYHGPERVLVGATGWCRTGYGAGRKAAALQAEHARARLRPDWAT